MTPVNSSASSSPFAVFQNRKFSLLWMAELVSTSGSALTSLAAGILIFRLTGSALSVGLMLMATSLPTLFVGLIAGVFVDRYDRKMIMIVSDLLRALLVALIPVLISYNIAFLYIIVGLTSAIGQFFDPAHESVIPEIASEEELASANSLIAISSFGATAIGFAASGLIASKFSISWAFYIDALTFLFSAACIAFISIPKLKVEGKTSVSTVVTNLKAGARFLLNTPILRSLLLVSIPAFLSFGLWNTLILPFAIDALHASEFVYGIQEGLTSVGFVAGSLLMAIYADRLREGQWIALGYLGMGIVGVFYGLSTHIPIAIMWVMISGFLNAPTSIARRLVIQRNTTREVRGRVNSSFFVLRDVIFLFGMAAAGLADVIDVRVMVIIDSLLLVGTGVIALVLPGLGQPAAEWRRAISLLRGVKLAPGLSLARPATLGDMDALVGHLPVLSGLSMKERQDLASHSLVADAPSGTTIIRKGDKSDNAYFILKGKIVAGHEEDGQYHLLEVLNAGDFFGEIAALTGVPRTADVVVDEPSTLLQVPAATLRWMNADPQINRIFLNKMTERMVRMNMLDLPLFSGLDQDSLRELRTANPEPAPGAEIA
jgi:DHA3 family macrolide efflux protein-like MFS transporter